MYKSDAIKHYGSISRLAKELGVTYQAVYLWPERVPRGRAYQLQLLTRGRLSVLPSLYINSKGDPIPTTQFPRQPHPRQTKNKN